MAVRIVHHAYQWINLFPLVGLFIALQPFKEAVMSWWKLQSDVVSDLKTWEEENDARLPPGWTAEQVAAVEANGGMVDLITGEVLGDNEADATYVPMVEFDDDGDVLRIVR